MLKINFKKRLDLIVASMLPVCILVIGFLISRAMAGDTFDPAACENSYGSWFGKETPGMPSYCPGYNTSSTAETAYFSSIDNTKIHWHREQDWTFAVNTPWNTSTCNVTLDKDILAGDFGDSTDYKIGYWNGTESKWRDGDCVYVSSDFYKWFRKNVDGTNYRCPKTRYYETSQSYYDCFLQDRDYSGQQITDYYNMPAGKMIYPGDDLESTQADSGATYNCVAF